MNISPINPYVTPNVARMNARAAVVAAHAAPAGATGVEIPTDGPPGTDSRLWSVLTGQERSYFARAASPLVYGRTGRPSSASVRGQALNIRI